MSVSFLFQTKHSLLQDKGHIDYCPLWSFLPLFHTFVKKSLLVAVWLSVFLGFIYILEHHPSVVISQMTHAFAR